MGKPQKEETVYPTISCTIGFLVLMRNKPRLGPTAITVTPLKVSLDRFARENTKFSRMKNTVHTLGHEAGHDCIREGYR